MKITLPSLHAGQERIYAERGRFNVVVCGRRFGKTVLLTTQACFEAFMIAGARVGVFAPQHKQWREIYHSIYDLLFEYIKTSNASEGQITLQNGSEIDFWQIENNLKAGRGNDYDLVLIDEAAYAKDLEEVFTRSIGPTLYKTQGRVWMFSTPAGRMDTKTKQETYFYRLTKQAGWVYHHAPTMENPFISPEEIERERAVALPKVFEQEVLANFVDWTGTPLFESFGIVDTLPPVDHIGAYIDTAYKTGTGNDSTAVVFFAVNPDGAFVVDWDIVQISAAALVDWLPSVWHRLTELNAELKVGNMMRSQIRIEDKGSGIVLLQQASRLAMNVGPVFERYVSLGKAGRALQASSQVYAKKVQFWRAAWDKRKNHKGFSHNHLVAQLQGYVYGEDAGNDDLLDAFCYGVLMSTR